MDTFQQQTRDRARPSAEGSSSRNEEYDDTTPKVGTKRLFSNRESRQIEGYERNYNEYNGDLEAPEERHSDKRLRNADWPLPSRNTSPAPSPRPLLRNRNAPNSPSSRRAYSQQRSSKFQEGSMNDRVSQMPPTPYLDGEDEILSEYDPVERGRKLARPRKLTRRDVSATASVTEKPETNRSSSIFRFGKSLAASFNPTNWKIWSKGQSTTEDAEMAQLRILRERQSKAERIYKELKELGQFRDSAIVFPPSAQVVGQPKGAQGKHDSGVEFGENESESNRGSRDISMEEKRKGRVFLNPPKLTKSVPGSPVSHISTANSNNSSPNKSPLKFKRASLSNIKKSLASFSTSNLSDVGKQARRIPSRKDLQKQQKLVKKVSDLEGKLQAARKQLSDALSEPLPAPISQVTLSSQGSPLLEDSMSPPVPPLHHAAPERVTRRSFVPGALASLPSERLLAGHVRDEEEDEDEQGWIGKAVTVDHPEPSDVVMSGARHDERPKAKPRKGGQSPALLGKMPQGPGSSAKDHAMQGEEEEEDNHAPAMVKKSLRSQKQDIADPVTSVNEPTTKASDPNDGDYTEDDAEPEEEEEKEPTLKPQSKRTPSSKKRKSRFESLADDGGIYRPTDTESDPETEVKESPPRKTKKTLILNHTRKLQKTSPSRDKDQNPNTDSPPKRAPPLPPTETPSQSQSQSSLPSTKANGKFPARSTSLKSTLKSPPPSTRLSKSKPPPLPKTRQQSASPPPSSSTFTGIDVGPSLSYKKPSLQPKQTQEPHVSGELRTFADEGEGIAYSADPEEDEDVPPMPKMPKAIRLASGEVVQTQVATSASVPVTSSNLKNGRGNGKDNGNTVFKASSGAGSKSSVGKLMKERRENKRLERKRGESENVNEAVGDENENENEEENADGNGSEEKQPVPKKSFEWPDDVF